MDGVLPQYRNVLLMHLGDGTPTVPVVGVEAGSYPVGAARVEGPQLGAADLGCLVFRCKLNSWDLWWYSCLGCLRL